MRTLIVLALLGCVSAAPFLQDTPEVVAERARFQQLYNAAAAAAAAAPEPPQAGGHVFHNFQPAQTFQPQAQFTTKWLGPVAATIPAGVQGSVPQVPDTAEVAMARDAFMQAFRAQLAATTGLPQQQHVQQASVFQAPQQPSQPKWVGPVAATIPAGLPGSSSQVADTPEVAAARNAFLAAYNRAVAATRPVQQQTVNFAAPQRFAAPVHHPNAIPTQQAKWLGPVAETVPAGLPGSVSQVRETAEVSAATAAFQQAYNAAVAATTGRRF